MTTSRLTAPLNTLIAALALVSTTCAATYIWDGGGDGRTWHDPANWNPNGVPQDTDVAEVYQTVTVDVKASATVMGLRLAPRSGLSTLGATTRFKALGDCMIDGASLSVSNGGVMALPGVQAWQNAGTGPTWQVSGTNSVLELPGLTNLSSSSCCWFHIKALSGGQLLLTNLVTIGSGYVDVVAEGGESLVDMGALREVQGTSYPVQMEARSGGTVWVPQLLGGPQLEVTVRPGGTLPTAQLRQVNSATADGVAMNLQSVDSLDGASLYVSGGGVMALPGVQSWRNAGSGPTWQVSGTNSVLELPGLTNLSSSSCCWFHIKALSGGQLLLTNLVTIGSGYVDVVAEGGESLVDMGALREVQGTSYPVQMEARSGGTVWVPQLLGGPQLEVTVRPGGTLPTAQLRQVNSATADGVAMDLGAMTNVVAGGAVSVANGGTITAGSVEKIDGASLYVSGGGVMALPGVQAWQNAGTGPTWQVSGTNSVLELPGLTNLSSSSCCWFRIKALSGGQLLLTNLVAIGSGYVDVVAEGGESVVDMGALREVQGTSYPVQMETRSGGTVWVPQLLGGPQLEVTVRPGGRMPTAQLRQVNSATADGVAMNLQSVDSLDGASLYVSGGGVMALPGVQSWRNAGSGPTWQVSGTNSVLELPGLTNLSSSSCCWFHIKALSGGQLLLTNLVTIGSGYVDVVAEGGESLVDMGALREVQGTSYPVQMEARSGGTVWVPQLLGGPQLEVTVRPGGTLPTAQLRQVNSATADGVAMDLGAMTNVVAGGAVSVTNGGTITAGSVEKIDGASLYVSGGGVMALPGVQAWQNAGTGPTWQVSGTNSVLELPGLTNLSSSSCCWFRIKALSGGQLLLTNLVAIGSGYVDVVAEGGESVVDMGALREVQGTSYPVQMETRSGGTVWVPQLLGGPQLEVTVRPGGRMPTAQLRQVNSATADGVAMNLQSVDSLDGASLYVSGGGVMALPGVQSWRNAGSGPTWQVSGTNSVLELPGLTNLSSSSCCWFHIKALSGGQLLLTNLVAIGSGYVDVVAEGGESVVDMGALREVQGTSHPVQMEARKGGRVVVSRLTDFAGTGVTFLADGAGSLIDLTDLVRLFGGNLEAKNGGLIRTPKLFFVEGAKLIVRGTAQIDIAQIRKLTNSRVTADGTTLVFAELFNWTGTVFDSVNGGNVSLRQADFVLSNLTTSTNQLWCGDRITVSWQGASRTSAAVLGSWTDALYLSADDRWDINDVLVARVDHTNGLAQSEVYSVSTNIFVPGVLPGDCHLLLRTVAFDFMGTLGQDNILAAPVPVFMPELTVGTPATSEFLAEKHARYWRLVTEADKDLKVSLDLLAATGATELYLRQDAIPTRSEFDVKFSAPGEPDQFVRIPGTSIGTNYVMALAGAMLAAPKSLELRAQYLPFALTSVEPDRVGNQGSATVKLVGSGIQAESKAVLAYTDDNGTQRELLAVTVLGRSMEETLATFDLRAVPATIADVLVVAKDGTARTLSRALSIENGRPIILELRHVGPAAARRHQIPMNFALTVSNSSNLDAEFVLVSASVPDHATVSMTVEGPLPFGAFASVHGKVSYMLPRIPPESDVTLNFVLRVDDRYPGNDLPIAWRVGLMSSRRFAELLAGRVERIRQAVLALPDLATKAPDLYALVADQPRWEQFMFEQVRELGFALGERGRVSVAGDQHQGRVGLHDECGGEGDFNFICRLKRFVRDVLKWRGGGWLWQWPADLCDKEPSGGGGCECGGKPGSGGGTTAAGRAARVGLAGGGGCGGDDDFEILNPQDPNAKATLDGWGPLNYITPSESVSYIVEFENQPTASAAALLVSVRDQLSDELDWSSVQLREIGFGGSRIVVPSGSLYYEDQRSFAAWTWSQALGWHCGETQLMVDVKAGVDLKTGLLTLNLTCTDTNTGTFPADPYAGFLPPNRPETFYYPTNETGCCGSQVNTNIVVQPGRGYITYTVKPRANLPTGTVITNAARIVFDWNDPIDTPVVFNTIDAGAPSSAVEALPSESVSAFLVHWSGLDDAGGCGIASYDIFVSADGGNYERWLMSTSFTSERFSGVPGVTYRFYSVARDWVGNEEAASSEPDAETYVTAEARLQWRIENAKLVLLWPASLDTAVAETALQVQGPYAPLGLTPIPDGDQLKVEVPLQHAQAYFRLRLP